MRLRQRQQTDLFAYAEEDTIFETGLFASSLPLGLLGYLPNVVSGVNLSLFGTLGVRKWFPLNFFTIPSAGAWGL